MYFYSNAMYRLKHILQYSSRQGLLDTIVCGAVVMRKQLLNLLQYNRVLIICAASIAEVIGCAKKMCLCIEKYMHYVSKICTLQPNVTTVAS